MEDLEPLLDIYNEVVALHDKMDLILKYLQMPWYKRFWMWLTNERWTNGLYEKLHER